MAKGYVEHKYRTWSVFKSDIARDISGDAVFPFGKYVFRGQTKAEWGLVSNFDRTFSRYRGEEKRRIENNLLDGFKARYKIQNPELNIESVEKQRITALGQHYGLPTRLLDWTYSVYIASFFAFADTNCQIEHDPTHVAIWIADKENAIWSDDVKFIEESSMRDNVRQTIQKGLFIQNNSRFETIEEYIELTMDISENEMPLYKAIIPASERASALKDLHMMGIDYYSIYGGLEGCAKAAVMDEMLKLMNNNN